MQNARMRIPILLLVLLLVACAAPTRPSSAALSNEELAEQVRNTERAFAATMARRDHAAFASFLSKETVFYGGKGPMRGSDTVAAAWKRFYEKPEAPFSWEPDTAVVLDSGTLALTSGPVHDPAGKLIGTFMSIWRLEAPGTWRIVFDKGCDVCDCGKR